MKTSPKLQSVFRAVDGVLSALAVMLGTVTISTISAGMLENLGITEADLEAMAQAMDQTAQAEAIEKTAEALQTDAAGTMGFLNTVGVNIPLLFSLFLIFALIHLISLFSDPKADRLFRVRKGILAAIYLGAGAAILFLKEGELRSVAAVVCCFLEPIVNRVFLIIQRCRGRGGRRKTLRIVFPVLRVLLLAALLAAALFLQLLMGFPTVAMLVCVNFTIRALLRVMFLSFSRIRLDVLRKIIRKTYAAEILFGLALLIVSFSVIFYAMEPGITSYQDALWYSFALVTTIGFGDITVTTILCRILSVILGIYGIVVVALITSIVVNFYNEVRAVGDDGEEDEAEEDGEAREQP